MESVNYIRTPRAAERYRVLMLGFFLCRRGRATRFSLSDANLVYGSWRWSRVNEHIFDSVVRDVSGVVCRLDPGRALSSVVRGETCGALSGVTSKYVRRAAPVGI